MIEYLLLIICLFLIARWLLRPGKQPLMPPGPPSEPILGHLRMIPSQGLDMFFHELGQKFGGIVNLRLLRQNILVLNSVEHAVNLLDKKGANYSGRPHFPFAEIMKIDDFALILDYGEQFKIERAILHKLLAKTTIQAHEYRTSWQQHAISLVQTLGSSKVIWTDQLMFYATSIIMELIYGHKMQSADDPYIKISQDMCTYGLPAFKPNGGSLVELFPFLSKLPPWLPGNTHVRKAHIGRKYFEIFRTYPYQDVERRMAEGTATPCFLTSLLTDLQNGSKQMTPRQIEALAAVVYVGGAETISSILSIFTMAMVLHPECQKRAQEEINNVVGSDRLPDYNDRGSLPYVEGLFQELLRWCPIVPTGIPHVSQEDDIYNGYFIPKKTTVIANTRGMSLDETVYKNPSVFDPVRFLPKPEGRGEPPLASTFGFGRRICPGRFLADDAIWIGVVTILATHTITRPKNELGQEYIPDIQFDTAVTTRPRPFPCSFEIRDSQAQKILAQLS